MADDAACGGKPLGVSLQCLVDLVEAHGGRAAFAGLPTAAVKRTVLAATGHTRTSYAAQLLAAGSQHVAPATAFISHAYDDEFLGVLDAVAALEAREGASAFYYFDLLVVNQHGQGAVVPFEELRDEFGRSVRAIGRTLLVLRWADPTPLQRAWCVYEMATTLAEGASLKVLMPPTDAAAFNEALLNDFDSLVYKTCRVDVERAGALETADLDNIQRVIKEAGGFLKTNQLVIEAMKSWMVEEGWAALASADGEIEKAVLTSKLARLLWFQGKRRDAEPLIIETLAARRRTLGNEHPDTLRSIGNMATLLSDKGKYGEAEPLFLEALAVSRRTLGNEHLATLHSISNMAYLLSDQGKYDEAEPLFLEALAAFRRTLGNEHPDTLASIDSMAFLLRDQGKYNEAEPLFLEALAASRRTLGNEHPDTLASIDNMASLLRDQGKYDEAEPLYLEVLAASRRTLGNEHPDTLDSVNNFARLLSERGDLISSEELYMEGLPICRRLLGDTNTLTLQFISGLAACLRRQERFTEALPLAREAYDGCYAKLGISHLATLFSAHELGVLLRLLSHPEEALPYALAAFEGRLRLQGSKSRLTLASQLSVARLQGDLPLASSMRESGVNE